MTDIEGIFSFIDSLTPEQNIKVGEIVEEARADERNKVIEEVRELIAYSSFEMTPGGRPMKRTCSVEEAMRQLEKDVAKLNQLKGTDAG